MDTPQRLVAISLAQWREWISELRLAVLPARIALVENRADLPGFARLVERSLAGPPDDASLLLARLQYDHALPFPSRTDLVDIDIAAVIEFLPLSADGRVMLESDAAQLGVCLGIPEYEQLWKTWRESHRRSRDAAYGRQLANLFKLPDPCVERLSSTELSWLEWLPSRAENEKRKDYEASQALCWFDALARFFDRIGDETKNKKEINERFGLSEFLRDRKADHDFSEPCIDQPVRIQLGKSLRLELLERTQDELSFLQLVVISHYRYLLLTDRKLAFESLQRDLSALAREEGQATAATAAFFIGLHMPSGTIAMLSYADSPEQYRFLGGVACTPLKPVDIHRGNSSQKEAGDQPGHSDLKADVQAEPLAANSAATTASRPHAEDAAAARLPRSPRPPRRT